MSKDQDQDPGQGQQPAPPAGGWERTRGDMWGRRKEDRERDILQAVMNGAKNFHLAYLDRDFNFVRVNETYARSCGYRPEDMIGKNHFELYPHPENEVIFAGVRDTGEPVHFQDKPFEFPDQPERGVTYWDWTLTPVKDPDGQSIGLVFSLFETTERKRTEEQLKEVTQRLNYHMDTSPLAVLEWGSDMRLIRWSGAAESMFGWEAQEVLGKRFDEFRWVYEQDEARVAEIAADLHCGVSLCRFSDNRNYRKNGSVVHCEWYNTSFVDEEGNLGSVLSLGLDVTARKKLEESLQQYRVKLESMVAERTAELREKDRLLLQQNRMAAMGEMVNSIAHQWRQPLNALGLHIQSLTFFRDTENFEELVAGKVRESMALIQHMSRTIDDFRNFYKPDKEKVAFSVTGAIEQAITLVEDSFRHHRIDISTRFDGEAWINGYPNEFAQALLNILQNSRDALQERGADSGMVTIASRIEDGEAVITITDTAGGIPKEILGRIFEPYFSTKGTQGTGIGLYMSKSIIETNMKGRITARNTGDGAEFRIVIPQTTRRP